MFVYIIIEIYEPPSQKRPPAMGPVWVLSQSENNFKIYTPTPFYIAYLLKKNI